MQLNFYINFISTPAQSLSVVGEVSAPGTPLGSSLAGSGVDEDFDIDEDSNTLEDDDEYRGEAIESMPERIPKIKRYIIRNLFPLLLFCCCHFYYDICMIIDDFLLFIYIGRLFKQLFQVRHKYIRLFY